MTTTSKTGITYACLNKPEKVFFMRILLNMPDEMGRYAGWLISFSVLTEHAFI